MQVNMESLYHVGVEEQLSSLHADLVDVWLRCTEGQNDLVGKQLQRPRLPTLVHTHPLTTHTQPQLSRIHTVYTLTNRENLFSDTALLMDCVCVCVCVCAHLHIKQGWSISLPLLDKTHVFFHGLVLFHSLQFTPFFHQTTSQTCLLVLQPRLNGCRPLPLSLSPQWPSEAPPQRAFQKTTPLSFCGWCGRCKAPCGLLYSSTQAVHREHLLQLRQGTLGSVVSQQILKPKSSQKLQRLFWSRILTPNDSFMGLREREREREREKETLKLHLWNTDSKEIILKIC